MSDPFGGGFMDDLLKGPFGDGLNRAMKGQGPLSQSKKEKPEKGLPWEAKTINGEWYIPLRQVADLLKQNNVLPKVRQGIENRVSLKESQKDLDGI